MSFEKLLSLNVNDKTEKKGNLTYLSWSWAWAEFKKVYPKAEYRINSFKNAEGVELPYMYDSKTGYMVMTEVTVDELTHEMWLPVMDFRNKAMMDATMFDINKTIMRCLTKNLAMFGLGLYIYAGEDLPEQSEEEIKQEVKEKPTTAKKETDYKKEIGAMLIELYGKEEAQNKLEEHTAFTGKDGKEVAGVRERSKLSDARARATYGKLKEVYKQEMDKEWESGK